MSETRFQIGTTIYTSATLGKMTLRDLMVFRKEAPEVGITEPWSVIEAAGTEIAALSKQEADAHPLALVLFAVTIWASRRAAGETVTFSEAIDFPLESLKILPGTSDRPTKAGPTKKASTPRTASAPVDEPEAPEADETLS